MKRVLIIGGVVVAVGVTLYLISRARAGKLVKERIEKSATVTSLAEYAQRGQLAGKGKERKGTL